MKRRRAAKLAELGENEILARIARTGALPVDVALGPGDDCAHLRLRGREWVWTTDAQIEGTHFERSWMTPHQIGRRAYLVNASDIAAMAGRPRFALVALSAPADLAGRDIAAIQRGIVAAASRDDAVVVGGNLSRGRELAITISLLGEAPRCPLLRSGARSGDGVFVTGRLGDAALGLSLLRGNARAHGPAVKRFREPPWRVATARVLARRGLVTAMMDLSDGLVDDLARMCRASGVGARIDAEALPMSAAVRKHGASLALVGGEDYELLCAVPPRKQERLASLSRELGCPMTRIGVFSDMVEGVVVDGLRTALPQPFEHFRRGVRG